jgi:hypothetical protein
MQQKIRTHLRLHRPSSCEVGRKILVELELRDSKTQKTIPDKTVIFRFNRKEIGTKKTQKDGYARFNFVVPQGTPQNREVEVQAEVVGDAEISRDIVTGKIRVLAKKQPTTKEIPPPIIIAGTTPSNEDKYQLDASDAVFYDSGTVVKYYGGVALEARLTKNGMGVNGKTVTFQVVFLTVRYTLSAVTDRDGYARISLTNATWILPGEGPWDLWVSCLGATDRSQITLQKLS